MAEKGKNHRSDAASKIANNLQTIREFGIRRIGVFGSAIRGESTEDSDIDILVEFETGQEKFSNLIGLYFYLQNLLGGKVDLVTRDGLSSYIAPYILREVEYIEAAS